MAVYTQVSAEAAAELLMRYDVGKLVSLKGIAEGVENSNYLLETDRARFILTLYENRVNPADLPYFHNLLAHLHNAGCPVPRFIDDSTGQWLQDVHGKKSCLIEFLPWHFGFRAHTRTSPCGRSISGKNASGGRRFWRDQAKPLGSQKLETAVRPVR
jgi:hypothetical protein